jgi:hypothetical protein
VRETNVIENERIDTEEETGAKMPTTYPTTRTGPGNTGERKRYHVKNTNTKDEKHTHKSPNESDNDSQATHQSCSPKRQKNPSTEVTSTSNRHRFRSTNRQKIS